MNTMENIDVSPNIMMSDSINSKISIKNMLFTRAIPNYVIPVPIHGYKTYCCTDCGDKFLFQSSYEDHVNRKSVLITYMCRHCHQKMCFKNRCNLLSHIRSHVFKYATINVSDLTVEPLPLSEFDCLNIVKAKKSQPEDTKHTKRSKYAFCFECKKVIFKTGVLYKDRMEHCMLQTNEIYTCPICLFSMPTQCAYKAHMRIHNADHPFYCPECGVSLTQKTIGYPYNHSCNGFLKMKDTTRVKCPIKDCGIFHPSNLISHMLSQHTKKVFKCSICIVACFNIETMERHLTHHTTPNKNYMLFYQCHLCPGRLVLHNQIEAHLKDHPVEYVYPCWTCSAYFKVTGSLLLHSANSNCTPKRGNLNAMYRVVKRCDRCKLYFTYKCKYDEIGSLPNECPYKCSPGDHVMEVSRTEQSLDDSSNIICHLCKISMSSSWEEIKKHYAVSHKEHRCLDGNVNVERLNLANITKKNQTSKPVGVVKRKTMKRVRNSSRTPKKPIKEKSQTVSPNNKTHSFVCIKCSENFDAKKEFEKHMVIHRDPCTAYQCLECGQCFVVKPSFITHLLVEHGITEVDEYINSKPCYNEDAFIKYQNTFTRDEPLLENQCNICRDKFDNHEDLEKHFRVHGMAFLKKNSKNNISP